MFETEHRRYAQLGGSYFWFAGKRALAWSLFKKAIGQEPSDARILDIGCGPGYAFAEMTRWGRIVGLDPSSDALAICRNLKGYGPSLVNGTADHLPFRDGSFFLVVAFEIFEHLDNDRGAIRECWRVLQPQGWLVLTVPAFRWLWGDHDELYFHKRRYRIPEIQKKIEAAGFKIARLTYCHALFVAPLWLMRRAKKLWKPKNKLDDFVRPPNWVNQLLTRFITSEALLLRYGDPPWGVSIIGIVRKS